MIRQRLFIFTLLGFLFGVCAFRCESESVSPRLETYITAQQVEQYFSTPEDRIKALQVYQNIGISKVYLESLRSGFQTNLELLRISRDFLQENGIEVSGGITTTAGENFGSPSNQNRYWLNYQHPKTQTDIAEHLRRVAPLYDEIIVDDFFATDDDSEMSQVAKGDRRWPEYRLALMADFAERFIIRPAHEANPNIQLIEKFPQWYDRFHLFGYNLEAAPRLFDRVWVGTETRNPDTKRFGYVMPTEGYINYRWIASLCGEKMGGAWFDFGDCLPLPYLMQAYQSVLAGARELVLFETGSLIEKNECIQPFMDRRNALFALGRLLESRQAKGMYAYKPLNSDGSDNRGAANLYIYDYIAMLGLAPLPVAQVPDTARCIFLSRQAADDPQIISKFHQWIKRDIQIIVTPDFLATLDDSSVPQMETLNENSFFEPITIDQKTVWVLKMKTFGHDEFAPDKEMFLPPLPLPIRDWPEEPINSIRKQILSPWGIEIHGPNNLGVYLFDDDLLILANFNDTPAKCSIHTVQGNIYKLHKLFPPTQGTSATTTTDACQAVIDPWELIVLTRSES